MSPENVEIVRELWDAYSHGDFDRVISLTDPYVVLVSLEEGPLYGPGRGRGSGVRVEQRLYEVYTLRNGRILRVDEFTDRTEALEAVGLRQ